jgi:large subunit ribosomal protein L17
MYNKGRSMMRRFKRDKDHRRSLMVNLAKNLIKHKGIKTTISKAKDLRSFVEPILTKSKINSLHNKRNVAGILMNDWEIVDILFNEISPKIQERKGGYTRIIRTKLRKGDGATEVLIELVDLPKTSNKPLKTTEIESSKIIKEDDIQVE